VFLHPVVSAGHVAHSGPSVVRNLKALFFMLGWFHCGFDKKSPRTRYAKLVFLHPMGSAGHIVHFGASRPLIIDKQIFHACIGTARIPQKARWEKISQTSFFHPVGFVGHIVHSIASAVLNVDALFLILRCVRYGVHRKRVGTRYTELVFCIQWDLRVT
jgi:hypothetical protein